MNLSKIDFPMPWKIQHESSSTPLCLSALRAWVLQIFVLNFFLEEKRCDVILMSIRTLTTIRIWAWSNYLKIEFLMRMKNRTSELRNKIDFLMRMKNGTWIFPKNRISNTHEIMNMSMAGWCFVKRNSVRISAWKTEHGDFPTQLNYPMFMKNRAWEFPNKMEYLMYMKISRSITWVVDSLNFMF